MPKSRRLARGGIAAIVVGVAIVGAAGCQSGHTDDGDDGGRVPWALTATPEDVSAVVVETAGDSAHVVRMGDRWRPAAGSALGSASQIDAVEHDLLPLQAYRSLKLDHDNPVYGLSDPWVTMHVFETDGDRYRLDVGAETFNRAGFYARRDNERTAYLLVRDSVAAMLSVARGERVALPDPTDLRIEQAVRNPSSDESGGKTPDAATAGGSADAWLQQSLRADWGGGK